MKLEREPDSNEIEEMEEEVEEYAVTDPLLSSNSMQVFPGRLPLALLNKWHASYILIKNHTYCQVEQTTETTPTEGSVHADMDTSNSLCSSSLMIRDFFYFKENV